MGSFLNHRRIRPALKGRATRGVWGHAPPENFEILVLWNVISSVLRGQFCPNCSLNQLSFLGVFLFGVTLRRSSQLYFIFCAVFEIVLDIYYFQLSILIVCVLHRHGSCVNPLGIARGQSRSNCYFSWKRCWLVFSYHGELSCFQVSKCINFSAYAGYISLCIYIVW